jgi:CDP-2,3-bis-(O-geranylgeranyl)-sn-glycerol synthase
MVAEINMSSWVYEVVYALFFIFPAYVANAIPVILGGGRPIDGGRKMPDGRSIFGSHKTVRGFVAGIIAGTLTGVAQSGLLRLGLPTDFVLPFDFTVWLAFVVSLGALVGDLVHSFVKRRGGLADGAPLPVADQLDFVVGAVLFSFFVSPPPWITIAIILVITLPIHLLTNILAHALGAKKTPW